MHNSARSLGRRYRTPFHTYCAPRAGERYRRQSGIPKGGGKRLQRLRSSSHAPRRSLSSKAASHSLSERAAMITPDYIRTMAEYNAEMNRRLYGAAARLSDPERRQPRGAFWGSIKADAGVSRAGLQGRRRMARRGPHLVQRGCQSRGPRTAAATGDPLLQPPDTSSWAGPRYADRSRPRDRRHRPDPGGPRDRRP